MRCLVIANANDADPGFVGHRLRHHGYALHEAHRERPDEWPALAGVDLVLLLGSEWSVYWESVAPSVEAECALVRAAADADIPVFGICFGAQIVAHALGGTVDRASRPEVGWFEVESDLPQVIAAGPWLQWHYDAFSVPDGFECVARSDIGPQAMRRGRILATQFHPEATESILARWTVGEGARELERLGTSGASVMAETRVRIDASRPASDRLVDWFVNEIARS